MFKQHFAILPLEQTDALWQVFLAENEQILYNSIFDFGIGYADNNFVQKLFLDGILMEIMVDIGDI